MKAWSIRLRLTLWYAGVLTLLLFLQGGAVYYLQSKALLRRIDAVLDRDYHEVEERLDGGRAAQALHSHQHENHAPYHLTRITSRDGAVLAQSKELVNTSLPVPTGLHERAAGQYHTETLGSLGAHRIKSGVVKVDAGTVVLQLATSLSEYDHDLVDLRTALAMLLPAGLLLGAGGGYWMARGALCPVQHINATVRRISGNNLGERLSIPNPHDELGSLAVTLNSMIDRLEMSFAAMRQFTADASHELRTPLTAIRTEVEITLRAARSPEEYQLILASVLEEVERLNALADSLLLLSREDAGAALVAKKTFRLDKLLQRAADLVRPAAEEAQLHFRVKELAPVAIESDPERLRQVVLNLLDNAIKYNRADGEVSLRATADSQSVTIEVTDSGIGISPEDLSRIFDRFYRVDKSRSRHLGGAGLGLSIAKSLVESQGGSMEVDSSPGKGSTFRVILPSSRNAS